jgi:hypothetical protein
VKCKHEPIVEGGQNPCYCCPIIPKQATMEKVVAVGFGSATATRDGDLVADGEGCGSRGPYFVRDGRPHHIEEYITFGDIEEIAVRDPDHDWRISLHGPLHGEVYQRQGVGKWMLIERDEGFA